MSEPTTDDEVLALAEKIKKQRGIDAEYARAYELACYIGQHYHDRMSCLEINFVVQADKWTGGISHHKINLPNDMADDLMQFLQNYIAEKNV
jgi:hypothetical protein